jgi:tRNA-binding EMAP/Myf-like protein
VNLAPRNLRGGVESQGMILMTTNAKENWFCKSDTDGVANGEINL